MMEARKEYEVRLARWRQRATVLEQAHRRTGNLRVLLTLAILVVAGLLLSIVSIPYLITAVIAGIFLSGLAHDRILRRRDEARRLAGFYQRGLDRLDDRWSGQGSPGTEFLDKTHPYAIDLDIFGTGGLFELVNTAQTQAGRMQLAQWLLHGTDHGEMAARQKAVAEMRDKVDLREELTLRTSDPREHIDTDALLAWAGPSPQPAKGIELMVSFCLPLVTWSLLWLGEWELFGLACCAQCGWALYYKRRTSKTISSLKLSARELAWLSELLACMERLNFEASRLKELQGQWKEGAVSAGARLRRLATLVEWVDSQDNQILAVIGPLFLLKTQIAFAVEAWRARHRSMIRNWVTALGEMEALSSLAGYGYEHPADVFPEWVVEPGARLIEARGLAHPLIADSSAVRNDLLLDSSRPLHVISGSNMSGKSTWLRAIGINVVLAQAGAPVRANVFRLSPLQIGASILTVDSLQEGVSRFYAEIKRLRQIVQLTEQPGGMIFLIDEVLGGTNSHDRQIGAASIAKVLVGRGAVGLITTHDLALTKVAEEMEPKGANFHFEDQLVDGKLSFDYRLRPGVVTKSNALDLMRSIGLEV